MDFVEIIEKSIIDVWMVTVFFGQVYFIHLQDGQILSEIFYSLHFIVFKFWTKFRWHRPKPKKMYVRCNHSRALSRNGWNISIMISSEAFTCMILTSLSYFGHVECDQCERYNFTHFKSSPKNDQQNHRTSVSINLWSDINCTNTMSHPRAKIDRTGLTVVSSVS